MRAAARGCGSRQASRSSAPHIRKSKWKITAADDSRGSRRVESVQRSVRGPAARGGCAMAMFDLRGRTALVTGAGQGVGAGIARVLAAQGARVGVNDLHAERAAVTVERIAKSGGTVFAAPFDVADYASVCAGIERLERSSGPWTSWSTTRDSEGRGLLPFREVARPTGAPTSTSTCTRDELLPRRDQRHGGARLRTHHHHLLGAGTVGLALGSRPTPPARAAASPSCGTWRSRTPRVG